MDAIAILTRNRPTAARRALATHVAHLRRRGHTCAIAVVDSSDNVSQQEATRKAVAAVGQQAGILICYSSHTDRKNFIERLAQESGVDPDLVAFALSDTFSVGHDAGANRNALLLAFAGKRFLSSDDDVVCEPHRRIDSETSLRLTSLADPTDVHLFSTFEDAVSAVPIDPNGDIVREHDALLGRSLQRSPSEDRPQNVRFESAPAGVLATRRNDSVRVAVTASGLLGDCGARFPGFYLWRRDVRDQLKSLDPERYKRLVESRQILRCTTKPTVASGPFFMSTHVGFDHRLDLPPFLPVLRGQDLIFGHLVRFASDGYVFGHVPAAVVHRPIEQRRASREALSSTDGTVSFAAIALACLRLAGQAAESAKPATSQVGSLGRQLEEIGRLADRDFEHRVTQQIRSDRNRRLAHWEKELTNTPKFSCWHEDLARARDVEVSLLKRRSLVDCNELNARFGALEGPQVVRSLIGQFGRLLQVWPRLVAAARTINRAGHGLFPDATMDDTPTVSTNPPPKGDDPSRGPDVAQFPTSGTTPASRSGRN